MAGILLIFFGGLVLLDSGDKDYSSTPQWIIGLVLVVLGGAMHMAQKAIATRSENRAPGASGTDYR